MTSRNSIARCSGCILLAAAVFFAGPVLAQTPAGIKVDTSDGDWHASVTPYLWLPGVTGSLTFDGPLGNARNISADVNPSDYLSHLEFGAMITAEVRKGDWSAFTDYIYLRFANQKSIVRAVSDPAGDVSTVVDAGSSATLKGNVWTLAGAYSVWRGNTGHLDVLVGTRYLGLDLILDWSVSDNSGLLPGKQGRVSASNDAWDGIVGVKGEIRLSDDGKWFMPYYLDVGAGDDNTTWQALLGAGYRFGWGSVTLSMRNLSYNFSGNRDADLRFTGPALGASFFF